MAHWPRARAQRGGSGRRPGRAGPGVLVPGRPMSDRPDDARVPGGADASEAGLTAEGAGTGPGADSGPDGTGPDGTGLAGTGQAAYAGLAAPELDADDEPAGAELSARGPNADAEPAVIGQAAPGQGAGDQPPGTGPATSTAPDTGTEAAATTRARAMAARLAGGWPLRRTFLVGFVVVTVFSLAAIVLGGVSLANLATARDRVVNKIDPAAFRTSQLGVAYLNQETGVRGYALSARPTFLTPYAEGLALERREVTALRPLLTDLPAASADLTQVIARAGVWRARYAKPTIAQVRATGRPGTGATPNQGKAEFDALRTALNRLQADLTSERQQAVSGLNGSAATLNAICLGIGISLLVILIVLAFILEISVIRPLSRLAADASKVADGDFTHHVDPGGPQ